MGVLNECSEEVIGVLECYLKSCHLARLYMTGNRALIRRLRTIRSTSTSFRKPMKDGKSSLVNEFLLGLFPNIDMTMHELPLLTATPMWLRYLRVTDNTRGGNFAKHCDLSALTRLESLEIGYSYAVDSPLVLPLSITWLSIAKIECAKPVRDLEKLPHLNTIIFHVSSKSTCHCHYFASSPSASFQWPLSLTSLSINSCHPQLTADALPTNLQHLEIDWNRNADAVDVTLLVRRQTCLTSLAIDGNVVISGPLPITLRTFDLIGRVEIAPGRTIVETFAHLPALTVLDVSRVTGSDKNKVEWQSDFEAAFASLLPRLTLISQENVLRAVIENARDGIPGEAFTNAFNKSIEVHGLGEAYLKYIWARKGSYRHTLHTEQLAPLANAGVSDELIRRIVCGRTVSSAFYHDETTLLQCEKYMPTCVRLLQLGCTTHFNLSKAAAEQYAFDQPMPESAICNIERMDVRTTCVETLDCFLQRNQLTSLVTLDVKVDSTLHSVEQVLEVIYARKERLPRLERVYFLGAYANGGGLHSLNLSPRIEQMMQEMRLFADGKQDCLTYRPGKGWSCRRVE